MMGLTYTQAELDGAPAWRRCLRDRWDRRRDGRVEGYGDFAVEDDVAGVLVGGGAGLGGDGAGAVGVEFVRSKTAAALPKM